MDDDAERLAGLARLLARDVRDLTDDELIAAARGASQVARSGPERAGRLLAALHARETMSWPKIAELVGLPMSTVYTWAQPYFPPDEGDERSPRRGQIRDP